jgi:hypothetical protein
MAIFDGRRGGGCDVTDFKLFKPDGSTMQTNKK